MASPTLWTWVWVNFRRWWRTGKPGILQCIGSQRVRHEWVTESMKEQIISSAFSFLFVCLFVCLFLSNHHIVSHSGGINLNCNFLMIMSGKCVTSLVLSHRSQNLKQRTDQCYTFVWFPRFCLAAGKIWIDIQISVTALCYSSVLFGKQRKIYP